MNETMNNKELVAAGHEFARHMSSDTPIIDIAKMVTRLASQLDVTTMALRHANAQFDSQSLELKAAVAAEIEWEKAMMQSIGADGIADVVSAIEKLKTDGAALAKESVDILAECIAWAKLYGNQVGNPECMEIAGKIKTPAIESFLAEQQALGVEKFATWKQSMAEAYHEVSPGCVGESEARYAEREAFYFARQLRDGVQL